MIGAASKVNYALVTPAKDEGLHIEKTIASVLSQTLRPCKWVLVSDGSVDNTDELIRSRLKDNPFMEFVRVEKNSMRDFSSKIDAFNKGYERLKDCEYDFIGNLDGDISFEPHYYETILNKFQENPKLGLAGGISLDLIEGKYHPVKIYENSVIGGIQLFRKECFDAIGGLMHMKYGGEDTIAELMVRQRGWQVRTFEEISVWHNEETGC